MATMDVVRIATFGAPNVMRLERLPVAEPGQGEMLLRVHAASVNPVDYKIRQGKYPAVTSDKLPHVLGRDVSGTVERCGPGMSDRRPGDEVYAMLGIERGAYAEHVIVSTLTAPSQDKARELGVRATRYTVQESGSELGEIAALIDAGRVRPKVRRTFALRQAAAAQELVERGHVEGKVVLQIAA